MGYRVGIDIGGTFTDFALLKDDTVLVHKNLSTPEDRSLGVMQGLETLAQDEGLSLNRFLGQCDAVVHGTTVADNTLIEMNGAVTGLITTEGFRDELEYRRGYKENIWDVRLAPYQPIVPRRRRLTVPERVLHGGAVHKPLDEVAVRSVCQRLRKQGVEAVAVSLIFSFVNPDHEKRVGEIVREELPDVHLSVSHEVLPRAPEYDRTSTTVVNAYVGPRVVDYINKLETRLREAGYGNELMVMQASGGVMTKAYIDGAPVRVLASGPAGGVVGSAHFGVGKKRPNLLCVDMGGTSYDMSVVVDGAAPAVAGWNMHHRNLIGVPMVQVETLGAGGGSICHVSNGVLQVGPRSAGSAPGPICYGRGGVEPTVTDALLMLGILDPDAAFAGGGFALTRNGVSDAFEAIGAELGRSAHDVARDCLRLVNANMTEGVRRTIATKGFDPKDMTMLAYGGNGPVFAGVQAGDLGIDTVLVPKASPAFSALGTLVANPMIDEERSITAPVDQVDIETLKTLWRALEARAESYFDASGFERGDIRASYQLKMRYAGQNWALTFDIQDGAALGDVSFADDSLRQRALDLFNDRHTAEYGHIREHETPEITGVRLVAYVETPSPSVRANTAHEAHRPEPVRRRNVDLGEGARETSIFSGQQLASGTEILGPAIIAEKLTTIVVYPGWAARVDSGGDYIMTRAD